MSATCQRPRSRYKDWSDAQARLWRRFELTIPLRKPLVVRFRDLVAREIQSVAGLPTHNRPQVIYVTVRPGCMVAIPKSCIIDIKLLYPD